MQDGCAVTERQGGQAVCWVGKNRLGSEVRDLATGAAETGQTALSAPFAPGFHIEFAGVAENMKSGGQQQVMNPPRPARRYTR